MRPAEAVWLLADIAAKNGNLLLDVGPAADGSLPEGQLRVLQGLADWMEVNREAIHGTQPYLAPGTPVEDNVRYTWKGGKVYAVLRGFAAGAAVLLGRTELMFP